MWWWTVLGYEKLGNTYRDKVGDAFRSVAALLGGRNGQVRVSNSGRERNVIKVSYSKRVLEFAEASQRFTSRALAADPSAQHGL